MANCPSCSLEISAGTQWCGVCRTNVLNQRNGRLASPLARLGAFFLDLAVPPVAFILIVLLGLVELGVVLVLAYIIWAFILFARGSTPGKKLLGIRVIKVDGDSAGFFTMLIRELIGKAISGMLMSLGFLWILIDRDKQCWHDKLMSTYVVEELE